MLVISTTGATEGCLIPLTLDQQNQTLSGSNCNITVQPFNKPCGSSPQQPPPNNPNVPPLPPEDPRKPNPPGTPQNPVPPGGNPQKPPDDNAPILEKCTGCTPASAPNSFYVQIEDFDTDSSRPNLSGYKKLELEKSDCFNVWTGGGTYERCYTRWCWKQDPTKPYYETVSFCIENVVDRTTPEYVQWNIGFNKGDIRVGSSLTAGILQCDSNTNLLSYDHVLFDGFPGSYRFKVNKFPIPCLPPPEDEDKPGSNPTDPTLPNVPGEPGGGEGGGGSGGGCLNGGPCLGCCQYPDSQIQLSFIEIRRPAVVGATHLDGTITLFYEEEYDAWINLISMSTPRGIMYGFVSLYCINAIWYLSYFNPFYDPPGTYTNIPLCCLPDNSLQAFLSTQDTFVSSGKFNKPCRTSPRFGVTLGEEGGSGGESGGSGGGGSGGSGGGSGGSSGGGTTSSSPAVFGMVLQTLKLKQYKYYDSLSNTFVTSLIGGRYQPILSPLVLSVNFQNYNFEYQQTSPPGYPPNSFKYFRINQLQLNIIGNVDYSLKRKYKLSLFARYLYLRRGRMWKYDISPLQLQLPFRTRYISLRKPIGGIIVSPDVCYWNKRLRRLLRLIVKINKIEMRKTHYVLPLYPLIMKTSALNSHANTFMVMALRMGSITFKYNRRFNLLKLR
jgi:hypothetical protein